MFSALQTLMLFVLPLVILVCAGVSFFLIRKQRLKRQIEGIIWLQAFRFLISHVQRHRGLTTSFLSREETKHTSIEEVHEQVGRDMEHIVRVGDWIKSNPSWVGITQHWAKLSASYEKLSIDNNIMQHNLLVKSILVFVDELALSHYLTRLSREPLTWREMLQLAELIGRSRALGMVVSSTTLRSDRSQKASAKLAHVCNEIRLILDSISMGEPSFPFISDYVDRVFFMLEEKEAVIAPNDFFDLASKTLEQLYDRFDGDLSAANGRLQN